MENTPKSGAFLALCQEFWIHASLDKVQRRPEQILVPLGIPNAFKIDDGAWQSLDRCRL